MRIPFAALSLLLIALAGCTGSSGSDDAGNTTQIADVCTLGICPAGPHLDDADFQPNAIPVSSFHQDQVASVNNLVRLDNGWAITMRDADGAWSLLVIEEATQSGRQFALPPGQTVGAYTLIGVDGTLYLTAVDRAADNLVMLTTWDTAGNHVHQQAIPDLPQDAYPKGVWNDQVLLIAPRGLLGGESAVRVLDGEELVTIGGAGRVMDAAMAQGLLYLVVEQDNQWRIEMQDVTGQFLRWVWVNPDESSIAAIYGRDDHIAFQVVTDTGDAAGGDLWEVDHRTHEVTKMGKGWDVHFVGDEVHHLTAKEGTSPFVTQWNRELGTGSEGVFLPDVPLWDVSTDGLWWLEAPKTDYRYKETPNPTPFTTMLMTTDR